MQDKLAIAAQIIAKLTIPTIPEEIIKLKEELHKNTQIPRLSLA
ncbi:hypothetical protein [Thiomicrorhabdus aquaedulcis]|nr:hypothetical protein [Thiomicrorhabdus aquaedulcis]